VNKKAILFSLIPAGVVFVAMDYMASYLGPQVTAPRAQVTAEYLEFDPFQMWRLRRGYEYRGIHISTDGFRHSSPVHAPAGSQLVFVLGGSTVFGVGASSTQTVTYFLQQLANQFQSDRKFLVVNAGVTGYYSTQELIHLERNVLPYHPALVISLTGRNDAFYGLHPNYIPDSIPYHGMLRRDLGALDPYYSSLETPVWRIHAMSWLSGLFANKRFDWLKDFESPKLSFQPAAIEVFLRNQRSVHSLLQGLSVRHFLFLQPTLNYPQRKLAPEEEGMDHDGYVAPLQQAYKRLCAATEESLDRTWFKGAINLTRRPGQLFIDNVHLSEAGARLTAQAIYRAIWGDWRVSRVSLASDESGAVLGSGWHGQEPGFRWTSDLADVTLNCPDEKGDHRLLVKGAGGLRNSHLIVRANAATLVEKELTGGAVFDLSGQLPPASCRMPVYVELSVSPAVSPKELGVGEDGRRLGVRINELEIR
jgi:lysophospholipase L1-like esterase